MSNTTATEPVVKVWLTFLCPTKLWVGRLSSVKHETLTVTLILRKWTLTAYIGSSENIGTRLHIAKMNINSLQWIFWEYWCKAPNCQTCSENTKAFSWKRKANLETFQILLSHIRVSFKLDLEFFKSLNRIFWWIDYLHEATTSQVWLGNTKSFISEKEVIDFLKIFFSYWSYL